jgi:hypothetical protein
MKVTTKCAFCRKRHDVKVSSAGYRAWRDGVKIQIAIPGLSEDDRERLVSGICPECWGEKFAED